MILNWKLDSKKYGCQILKDMGKFAWIGGG